MLTLNSLLKLLKLELPDALFDAMKLNYFEDILNEKTLPLLASYYPKVVKGIVVTQDMGVPTLNKTNGRMGAGRYVIPMDDEDYPFTGIATFNSNWNAGQGKNIGVPGVSSALYGRAMSMTATPSVRVTSEFEGPNVITLNPMPEIHMDFTVSMHRVRKLSEIKYGYHEMVRNLYECDVKLALYSKFRTVLGDGTYGGIPLSALAEVVQEFAEFKGIRDDLKATMDSDFYKDPDRFDEMFNDTDLG